MPNPLTDLATEILRKIAHEIADQLAAGSPIPPSPRRQRMELRLSVAFDYAVVAGCFSLMVWVAVYALAHPVAPLGFAVAAIWSLALPAKLFRWQGQRERLELRGLRTMSA